MKIITIVGTRPQLVKAALVSQALDTCETIEEKILHTGQHFDAEMSQIFFEELQIPEPKWNLNINRNSHGQMTGKMLMGIEEILLKEKPDALLVYGDTNSTLAGALAAAKLHIPIVHVEAGLRSFNRKMPEEINRVLTDHMSTLLFCPTEAALKNLEEEGISMGVIHTGDVMFDATLYAIKTIKNRLPVVQSLDLSKSNYGLVTIHRAENTDDLYQLKKIIDFLEITSKKESLKLLFPVHPRTQKTLSSLALDPDRFILLNPLSYLDIHLMLHHSQCVFTDSGGLQKEAYFHQKPCVTLREETEWVETVEHGWNRLWTSEEFHVPRKKISDYGDGNAAKKMAKEIQRYF